MLIKIKTKIEAIRNSIWGSSKYSITEVIEYLQNATYSEAIAYIDSLIDELSEVEIRGFADELNGYVYFTLTAQDTDIAYLFIEYRDYVRKKYL
jgi:hypothetical protein